MAIRPIDRYPGQTVLDPNYPDGKAQNISNPGDGTGTPWEKDLVNDWFGYFQGLLNEAGITPSGVPDTASASDYLDAVIFLIKNTTFDNGARVEGPGLSLADLPSIDPASFWRVQPLTPMASLGAGQTVGGLPSLAGASDPDWYFDAAKLGWKVTRVGAATRFPISNLVDNSSLTTVTIGVEGSGFGSVPASRPFFNFEYVTTAGAIVQLPTVTDTNVLATFNSYHEVDVTLASPLAISENTRSPRALFLRVEGPNPLAGSWWVRSLAARFTTTKLSPGG